MNAYRKIKTCTIRYLVPVLLCVWCSASFSNVRAATEAVEIEERMELISTASTEVRISKIPVKDRAKTFPILDHLGSCQISLIDRPTRPLFLLYHTFLHYE